MRVTCRKCKASVDWQGEFTCAACEANKCNPNCPGDDTCPEAKVCVCGDPIEAHSVMGDHGPVSAHDYYSNQK